MPLPTIKLLKSNLPDISNPTLYIAYHSLYAHPVPEGHRFPMQKYELIPQQLLHEGVIQPYHLHPPEEINDDLILLTHSQEYLHKLNHGLLAAQEQRKIGFLQDERLIRREKIITQGTINCCLAAIESGIGINVAGGTHHAFRDRGEGFCLLNDFAVASHFLLKEKKAEKILIIDLDVHQGNGTASIFRNDSRVFTFSMHGLHNYPFRKEESDLDIALPDGTNDESYLNLLEKTLPALLKQVQPDFAFYLSGVDILETDRFGKLKITQDGCKQRDRFVFEQLHHHKIPCTVAMGGGYSPDIRHIVEAHCHTFRLASDIYTLL